MALKPEFVRIAILDSQDTPLGFLDNRPLSTMHYYDDKLHLYLSGGAYTFEFRTYSRHSDTELIQPGNGLSFRHRGKDYYLKIMTVEKNEEEVLVMAYGASFALLNDYIGEMTLAGATIEEALTLVNGGTHPEVGNCPIAFNINEIATERRTGEFTSSDTVLARLYSLGDLYGAEIEIVNDIDQKHSLRQMHLNIYKKHDKTHQGIGQDRRGEILRYGRDIDGLSKTSDISDLATSILVSGSGGMTLTNWDNPRENGLDDIIYDNEGNVLYERKGTIVRAPQARDRFPSIGGMSTNGYITKPFSSSADTEEEIYRQALEEIKACSEPKLTYSVDGYVDADIGDTFTIEDTGYSPTLFVEARVVEQEICFTNPTKNKTKFDNFTEVSAEINSDLYEMMDKLKEEVRPYFATITVPNGTELEEPNSTTDISVSVEDENGLDVTANFTFVWSKEGTQLDETSATITIQGWDINGESATYKCDCYLNGVLKASAQCIMFCRDNLLRVELYYLLSDQDNGIQWDDPRWSTQMVEPTAAKPYVWSLAKHIYSKSDPKYIGPSISRKYAPPGEPGRGITLMVPQFFLSISTSELIGVNEQNEPVYPNSETILLAAPPWEEGKYLWTRTMIHWTAGDPTPTEWVLDSSWMQAYDTYAAIQDRLNAAETVVKAYLDPDSFSEMIKTVVSKEWFETEADEEGNPILDDDGNPVKLSVDDKIKALAKQGTEFVQTSSKFEMTVQDFTTQLKQLDGEYQGFIEQFNKNFTFDTNGLSISAIVGEGEDAVNALLKMVVDNDNINIIHTGTNAVSASFGVDSIRTNRGEFRELDLGSFGFRPRANGGLSFKKIK